MFDKFVTFTKAHKVELIQKGAIVLGAAIGIVVIAVILSKLPPSEEVQTLVEAVGNAVSDEPVLG